MNWPKGPGKELKNMNEQLTSEGRNIRRRSTIFRTAIIVFAPSIWSFGQQLPCNNGALQQCLEMAQSDYTTCVHDSPRGYTGCATLQNQERSLCYAQYGVCKSGYYCDGTACVNDPIAVFDPKFMIMTILYSPPGNSSSAEYDQS